MDFARLPSNLTGVAGFLLVISAVGACGGGGGGSGGGTFATDIRASDFRRGTSAFSENEFVQPLLDPWRGGLSISSGTNPPNIEGEYAYSGIIDYSEILPGDVGRSISGRITFQNQGFGLVDIIEQSPTLGNIVASGWFLNGSSASSTFTICYSVETTVDIQGYDCTETDVGIINGSRRANGDLELQIGFVAVGLRGGCIDLLQRAGVSLGDILGQPVVTVATATRLSAAPPPIPTPTETTISLYATEDTCSNSHFPDSNYGGERYVSTGEYTGQIPYIFHGFLRFDLSSIPAGSTIVSATLRLPIGYDSTGTPKPTGTTSIYRITSGSWSEYTLTHNNRPTAYAYVASKQLTYETTSSPQFDVTAAVVGWVQQGYANRGFAILSRNITLGGSTAYFYSREQYSAGSMLEVTYR